MLRAPLAVGLALLFAAGGLAAPAQAAEELPTVLLNELANGGPASNSDSFFELRNWGTEPVDLTGWHVFRCSSQGLRSNIGRPESDLTGVVLQPGAVYTVSKSGMPGDAHITQPFGNTGFGLYLEGPDARLVDAVGVYPNEPWPTESECTYGRNLPNSLDFAAGESWQRTSPTTWITAPSTLGQQNATAPAPREATSVVISEVASSAGDFVELQNLGRSPEDIGGWLLYRCTATGRVTPESLEATLPAGAVLAPGEFRVIDVHLADVAFGVKLESAAGRLVDRVSVSDHADSACQDGDQKLPAIADAVAGESYQRTATGYVVAPRTPGEPNATAEDSVFREPFEYGTPGVAISEIADDPSTEGMPAGTVQRNYIELGNYGTKPVDIGGWTIRRCEANGMRSLEPQVTVAEGTRLEPGEVYLAAREGTAAASGADAAYAVSLNFLGTGVWVADADGERVDSAGVYAANEMDSSNITGSPCTLGVALTTYQPDRLLEETFQRTRFTGSNSDDFLARPATPGEIDLVDWVDPTERVVTASTAALGQGRRSYSEARVTASEPATVLEAWAGVTQNGPLTTLAGADETAMDAAAPAPVTDSAYGFPYARFTLDASALAAGSTVGWAGSTAHRDEVQLSVWSGSAWRLLQSGSGEQVALAGVLEAADIHDGVVSLLVQDGPRGKSTLVAGRDGALEDPADYDFAVTHITDTQYLSESYPEVYAQLVSWIADNRDDRKIAFAQHTGDLIQNWVDPDQNDVRARIEYGRASAIQSILDDAGVPNGVLPGNHDIKRGMDDSLFNEYFPPSRYEGTPWYGGSIAPGDNTANFSTFEWEGAKFLMLALPYAYGEREMAWAETVVASHPDYNIIVATHEHVMPKTLEEDAHRSTNSRWVSHGGELWDRVIAPNRNVVLVLSGHFHGIGQLVTENAGGIEGHTVVEMLADYQEFRTHTGERATGFYRMLQFDLDAGAVAVDTRSVRLAASYSYDYDYRQFLPDNGLTTSPSNMRPWRIVDEGVQGRYDEEDDEFTSHASFQHPKSVSTSGLWIGPHAE